MYHPDYALVIDGPDAGRVKPVRPMGVHRAMDIPKMPVRLKPDDPITATGVCKTWTYEEVRFNLKEWPSHRMVSFFVTTEMDKDKRYLFVMEQLIDAYRDLQKIKNYFDEDYGQFMYDVRRG